MSEQGDASGIRSAAWPKSAFEAPILRTLGERGRADVTAAGRIRRVREGEQIYAARDASDAFFVVVSGKIELTAVRRGDEHESVVRSARRGDTFGEEALLVGAVRSASARAAEDSELAEVPVAVLVRAAERSGGGDALEREQRALRRLATRDLIKTTALAKEISDDDVDLLLDAVSHRRLPRSTRVFSIGDKADSCFFVADGLVQLQTENEGKIQVRAYLSRGDFFGDEDLIAGAERHTSAVALGDCELLVVPASALLSLSDRNPGLLGRLRRIAADRAELQHGVVGAAAARSTQHVFQDLYRMQMARSLLAIDQETCVRCGHCALACAEVHGVSRLVRRGDKIITELEGDVAKAPKSLLIPNSCQHCKNPVCMIDCPTGAIGRDPEGEVFIREALCTGCGACAKACPWENIRMAPRGDDAAKSLTRDGAAAAEVAVKCDLCRDYEGPACVQACPTESILRLDPARDFAEVGRLLGASEPRRAAGAGARRALPWQGAVIAISVALGISGFVLHADGVLVPGRGVALLGGWLGALGCVLLASYAIPKRRVRLWMRRRERASTARRATEAAPADAATTRSRLRPLAELHVALGLFVAAAVAAHSGARSSVGIAGALGLAFWATALSGIAGALAYRFVPRALSRLERRGALPEDFRYEREALSDRLYRAASGKSELVKKLVERMLLPYARSPLGSIMLTISGRSLRQEESELRARIERTLEGRGSDKLGGIDELVRIVVEIRALPARRVLTAALRVWLPLHVLLTASLLVLLVLHVVSVVRW